MYESGLGWQTCLFPVTIRVMKQEYVNDNIRVTFDPEICTHSGNCVRGLASVFDINKKPWVNVDGGTSEDIEKAVLNCPSGALSFEQKSTGMIA